MNKNQQLTEKNIEDARKCSIKNCEKGKCSMYEYGANACPMLLALALATEKYKSQMEVIEMLVNKGYLDIDSECGKWLVENISNIRT